MNQIAIIPSEVIETIQSNQILILKMLEKKETSSNKNEQYLKKNNAAKMLDCDEQTISNFEKEGLIKKYGRGRFIRYSKTELKQAMGIEVE